jgi:hypothetical protein
MAPSASIDTTAAAAAAAQAAATLKALPHPKDLSHHYSQVTKNRVQSRIKAFYRFIQTPGISNFSGGECFASVSSPCPASRGGAGPVSCRSLDRYLRPNLFGSVFPKTDMML